MRLGIRDERVLRAFVERRPAEGVKLRTDGQRLDGLWLGGSRIADWDRDQIHFHDKGSRAAESVQRAIRRHAAPVQLAEFRGLAKTRGRRDSARARAMRQMKATNRVMMGKHGTGREWFKGVGTDPPRGRGRRPGMTTDQTRLGTMSFDTAIQRALSEREWQLRRAANGAAYGERHVVPEPREPNAVEDLYLQAIEAFKNRRPTAGYDLLERGDHRALLRYGRSRRRRRF